MDTIGDQRSSPTATEDGVSGPTIIADIASSFTYASFQNAIPVIRSIAIENHTDAHFERCTLELTSSPPFLRAKTWTVDRLIPGDHLALSDRRIELDADYLAGLNEAERGEITLRLSCSGDTLDEQRLPVRLLARDEWGGMNDMAQLLPAFVMPNDPAVATLLRDSAERLAAHGHSSALDGYQSGNPQRAYMLAAAIYSATAALGLHYAEPPASFESDGQKIRRPMIIAQDHLATCLDTSLLFAAVLEGAGLHPVILMFKGHSAVGVWLTGRAFANSIETDQMEIRKALASRELMVFETTGVTHRPPMTMDAAQYAIDRRLDESQDREFVAAIDVHRSRDGGVTPLASHDPGNRAVPEEGQVQIVDLPLPPPPNLGELPADAIDVKPTTAAGRIDRWQKKLLDLTLRNRLLNFPDSKGTIPFLCPDVADLEDRLADGTAIRIISLPEQNPLGQRDASLYREVHGEDLQQKYAAEALLRNEVSSTLEPSQLQSRLTELYRRVRNDFAEGGANTLFLAVGFLRWKKRPQDERTYRAPLLLVPVKLVRRSANSRFTLRYHEDEPRFNATLLQFLEREFDLRLPQFGGELPGDDSGVDVPLLLTMMRHAIRDVPGMEVVDEAALSTFSFAKFLMWKDLVERTDALRENRVVRHLIDTPEQAFQTDGVPVFREERDLDANYSPSEIVNLLPSDSSQTAACIAAAEGHDFVIVGPPGTGKSQTIANMIANCLAVGKTVLFVAEKTAALDVVYRRLREHGLGDHCVELHSNKADRRHFLSQLKTSWERGGRAGDDDWISVTERLKVRRDELNAYVEALHRRHLNGWTAYKALGIAYKERESYAPSLTWPEKDAHDENALLGLEELAHTVGLVFGSIRHRPSLNLVDVQEWSAAWQERLIVNARSLIGATELLDAASRAFVSILGLQSREMITQDEREGLLRLAHALDAARGHDIAIAFDADFGGFRNALADLEDTRKTYRDAEIKLSASYQLESIRSLTPDELDRRWREAEAAFWPKSMLAKRKVRKLLQSYAADGSADPETDLVPLQTMRDCLIAADENLLSGKRLEFRGVETDADKIARLLDLAEALRAALLIPDRSQEETSMLKERLPIVLNAADTAETLFSTADRLLAAAGRFNTAKAQFAEIAGGDFTGQAECDGLIVLRDALESLVDEADLIRDWAAWCQVRRKAIAQNLTPLVQDVEAGAVPAADTRSAFQLGYARWWLPRVLDSDPVLRGFRRFQHEHSISEFREIDEMVLERGRYRVADAIAHGLPSVQSVPRNSELGLLRHQMELQRPSQSIRDMIGKMPETFSRLAPCMLMSPLSIAQYLPPDHALFDAVIFDEASQITTWDAVGAIARARQTIIVGDPKQLPPTNFFGRSDEDEDVPDMERDMESILDEAKDAGIPVRDLRWHYRSRSESLIAFSNYHYYRNRLVTFPSPVVDDRAVWLRKVPNGVYDRGKNKSRTNRIEAEAVVAEAVSKMTQWLSLPEDDRPTLGIVTFNAQQQSLIDDLLEHAQRVEPELEWFFSDDRIEPTIVKNLENVQGDERDIILFSVTYWKDTAGKLTMEFGPLNRDGGERRLNVAVTRARKELIVFSGFIADLIDTTRTKAVGARHLKAFLDYAERGSVALPAQDEGSMGSYESLFEEAVAEQLERRGWIVVPQVGVSGFRVDLGIRDPDNAGVYLAGIECDGATYHSSATARDRDKVREEVLRGLGWNILRVWSTDWWFNARDCAEQLHTALEALLQESRDKRAAEQEERQREAEDEDVTVMRGEGSVEEPHSVEAKVSQSTERAGSSEQLTHDGEGRDASYYRITDLSAFEVDPDRFHDFSYRGTLKAMIDRVVETECPLKTDVLAQRIARAHGWQRTGGRIRDRIELHLRELDRTMESSGEFIWKKGSVREVLPYREPFNEQVHRSIPDTPLAELTAVVIKNPALLDEADAARELAHLLKVERLTATSRSRLDEAINRAREHINLPQDSS